jgi:hypothetical protein
MSWIFRRPFDFGARSRRWRTALLPKVLEFIASGGIVFGGSASVAVTLDHVASGGMVFGGSAPVAVTLDHVASGGMTFGGSAAVSFTVTPPIGGDIVFGGAAEIAFTKAVVGAGGIVFGGRAYIGDVIGSKFWLNGPGFELDDLLRAQQIDYDKNHNPIGVYSIDAEVVQIINGQKMVLQIVSGKEFLTNALKGQLEFVRLGNRSNTARQGSVMIQSQPACVAVMDSVDDFSKWGTLATYKGVHGKLDWINDPDFGQLSGWGSYIPRLYAKGDVILGPNSSIQWANVEGSGKPENNATYGADFFTNVDNRPLYLASTYIDFAQVASGRLIARRGAGNLEAGITSEGTADTDIRIYAGSAYADRATAPFRVTQAGSVYMGDAIVEKAGSSSKAKIDNGQVTLYGLSGTWYQAGYVAGERGGAVSYFNISANDYLRLRASNNPFYNLTIFQGDFEIRGDYTYLLDWYGNIVVTINHTTGFAGGFDADMLDGKQGTQVANAGGSSGATNPTLKRTVTLNGVTFDVACYN